MVEPTHLKNMLGKNLDHLPRDWGKIFPKYFRVATTLLYTLLINIISNSGCQKNLPPNPSQQLIPRKQTNGGSMILWGAKDPITEALKRILGENSSAVRILGETNKKPPPTKGWRDKWTCDMWLFVFFVLKIFMQEKRIWICLKQFRMWSPTLKGWHGRIFWGSCPPVDPFGVNSWTFRRWNLEASGDHEYPPVD